MKKSEGESTNCDPADSGGGGGAQSHLDPSSLQSKCNFRIGIYGWRKKCLYILILVLLVMVVVNLALTLWVLKVMEFSSEGMGQLKIVSGGIKLEGRAFILDSLIASSIKSRNGQPIVLESSRNITFRSRNVNGHLNSWIHLGNDQFECLTNNFKILDDRGVLLFSTDRNEVVVGAELLHVTGEGGTSFKGSVQTTLVRAESGHDLRLESSTRMLSIKAPKQVTLESRGGEIKTVSLKDITLKSEVGAVNLQSPSVVMPLLPTARTVPRPASTTASDHQKNFDVYQLCACESGKLFLAAPHAVCASQNDDVFCR